MTATTVATELADDPLGRGYAAMTTEQVLASLAARDRPAPVPAKDVRRYLDLVDRWPAIAAIAAGIVAAADDAQARVAIGLRDALVDGYQDFDLAVPAYLAAVSARLQSAVDAGLIAAEHKDAILALGADRRTRAEELGLGRVKAAHVIEARGA